MKILLIEDDPMIGQTLSQFLKNEGYAVNWCPNGTSGSQAIEVESYELVLLDLRLPDMSGLDVLKKSRSLKIATPVLILTARDAIDDRVAGLDAGVDDYLIKPFAIPELAIMKNVMEQHKGYVKVKSSPDYPGNVFEVSFPN